jgi:hypothetical protein
MGRHDGYRLTKDKKMVTSGRTKSTCLRLGAHHVQLMPRVRQERALELHGPKIDEFERVFRAAAFGTISRRMFQTKRGRFASETEKKVAFV